MKDLPIVFAIDDNYADKLSVVIRSILLNGGGQKYKFFILTKNLSNSHLNALKRVADDIDKTATIDVVDMTKIISYDLNSLMSKREGYCYISSETYFRFFIHKAILSFDKVLYLDADVVVLDDIKGIFDIDLGDCYAGVVADIIIENSRKNSKHTIKTRPDMTLDSYIRLVLKVINRDYFNAGVMLLNLNKLRQDRIDEKLLMFANRFSPLEFQDQDALNAVFDNRVKFLPLKWNLPKDIGGVKCCINDCETQKEIARAVSDPGIVHFVGGNKPWMVKFEEYDFLDNWWSLYLDSGFCSQKDKERYKRICATKKYRQYYPYFRIRIHCFDVLHIYRENFRYYFVFLGRVFIRRKMAFLSKVND